MAGPLVAFAPGKVILLGEHAVVYGHPALAASISAGVRARGEPAARASVRIPSIGTASQREALRRAFRRAAHLAGSPPIRVTLESTLPLSVGLGSSGALAVAVARVLLAARGGEVRRTEVEDLALEMEREFHGTPSGLDHLTSSRGSLVFFAGGKARPVETAHPLKVLVAIAGERGSTRAVVQALRTRKARWPRRYQRLFGEIGALAHEGAQAVKAGDLDALGDLMNVNQGLLNALGLSSVAIESMAALLRAHGARGAKLTGAGGGGGAVIGLFPEPEPVVARLRRSGITYFSSQLAGPPIL